MNFAMATLGLKEFSHFLQFPSKMKKKVWYYEKWVGRHASFPPRRSVKPILNVDVLIEKAFSLALQTQVVW